MGSSREGSGDSTYTPLARRRAGVCRRCSEYAMTRDYDHTIKFFFDRIECCNCAAPQLPNVTFVGRSATDDHRTRMAEIDRVPAHLTGDDTPSSKLAGRATFNQLGHGTNSLSPPSTGGYSGGVVN